MVEQPRKLSGLVVGAGLPPRLTSFSKTAFSPNPHRSRDKRRCFWLRARDLVIPSLLVSRRVGSSMVEQRPFKALVVGSSPTQPKYLV
jgi:hypothetical protein